VNNEMYNPSGGRHAVRKIHRVERWGGEGSQSDAWGEPGSKVTGEQRPKRGTRMYTSHLHSQQGRNMREI